MKKKFVSIMVIFVLFGGLGSGLFSVDVNAEENGDKDIRIVNDNGIKISNIEYNRLESLGFNEEEIMGMDQEEYDRNKGLSGTIVETDTKYVKIEETIEVNDTSDAVRELKLGANLEGTAKSFESTDLNKEEYYKDLKKDEVKESKPQFLMRAAKNSDKDVKTTAYKKMTLTLVKLSNSTYRAKVHTVWNKLPKNRDYDVMGIAHTGNVSHNKNSHYAKMRWKLYDYRAREVKTKEATYKSNSSKWSVGATGTGVKMNLPNDDKVVTVGGGIIGYDIHYIAMYEYFTVSPNQSGVKRIDIYGIYSHAEKKLGSSFGFGISSTGAASISYSVSVKNKISVQKNTQATLYR